MTHLPFAAWCSHCVGGKLKEDRHLTRDHALDTATEVQCDYMFLKKEKNSDDRITCMSAYIVGKGLGIVCQVWSKGETDQYAVKTLEKFLLKNGLAGNCLLKHDPESAVRVVCEAVAKKMTGVRVEQTPVDSHQSLGGAERFHQSVQGTTRTLKLAAEENYGVKMSLDHKLTSWMLRHSGWLAGRYQKRASGMTLRRVIMNCWSELREMSFEERAARSVLRMTSSSLDMCVD